MGILADIRLKFLAGQQPLDLIKAGYAKSSVYYVLRKLKAAELSVPAGGADDEISELKRRKEIVKLQKEIAEYEATRENLPTRIGNLEKRFATLCELFETEMDNTAFLLMIISGIDKDEASRDSDGRCRKDHPGPWRIIDGKD